jgi:hypothetical protein
MVAMATVIIEEFEITNNNNDALSVVKLVCWDTTGQVRTIHFALLFVLFCLGFNFLFSFFKFFLFPFAFFFAFFVCLFFWGNIFFLS